MTEKYVLEVDIDHETGEEHCTVLKTDGTTNMANWIEIVSTMYTHHSILEPLVDELNKIQNNYNNTEKYAIKLCEENEELKEDNKSWRRTASHMNTIHHEDREYCEKVHKENKQLKKALLYYIDVALCETSSNFNKDFDNLCNNLFGCSYNEIKHLYSDINDEDDVFALFQGGNVE